MLELVDDAAFDLLAPRTDGRSPLRVLCGGGEHAAVWYAEDGGEDCWYAVESVAQAEALRTLADWRRRSRPSALHARSARGHTLCFVRLTRAAQPAAERATGGAAADAAAADDGAADEAGWHMVLAEDELVGLPDFLVRAAREAGQEKGEDGPVITLSRSLIVPFLQFSPRRDLREKAFRAWEARGVRPTRLGGRGCHAAADTRPPARSRRARGRLGRARRRSAGSEAHARGSIRWCPRAG